MAYFRRRAWEGAVLAAGVLLAAFLWDIYAPGSGLHSRLEEARELEVSLRASVEEIERENERLRAELERRAADPEGAWERQIRYELGLIKPGETFYFVGDR